MDMHTDETLIIGVDCATQPKNMGFAFATHVQKAVYLRRAGTGDNLGGNVADVLAQEVRKARRNGASVLLALDAPLGWPEAMRAELASHSAGRPLDTPRERMFSRMTDRFVRSQTDKKPLDVGANLIAGTAHSALALLQDLRRKTDEEIPLVWAPEQVHGVGAIEVYPALALLALAPGAKWADRKNFGSGYKKHGVLGAKPREEICKQLQHLWEPSHTGDPHHESDHAIDAVLCVQIAYEFLSGDCLEPPAHLPVIRREGWIWFSRKSCKVCGRDDAVGETAEAIRETIERGMEALMGDELQRRGERMKQADLEKLTVSFSEMMENRIKALSPKHRATARRALHATEQRMKRSRLTQDGAEERTARRRRPMANTRGSQPIPRNIIRNVKKLRG